MFGRSKFAISYWIDSLTRRKGLNLDNNLAEEQAHKIARGPIKAITLFIKQRP